MNASASTMPGEPALARRPGSPARLIALVRAATQGRTDLRLAAFEERTVRWAVETGLGPLMLRATAANPDAAASPLWPLLEGATLTARLLTALHLDAMAEIIDACRGRVPPLVLLKGISLCEQHYPEPHLRPMRDIDFLVEGDAVRDVESILVTLGYRRSSARPPAFYEGHHHSTPFVHPDTGTWVEVHRGLFPPGSALGAEGAFGVRNLTADLRPSRFRGRPVRRLSDELQVVYLACHWANGLHAVGGMVAMADMIYLLRNTPSLDWERILRSTCGSVSSRRLCLLLTYLDKHRLIDVDPAILHALRARRAAPGGITLRLAHVLIDHYVVDGREFGTLVSQRTFTRLWRLVVLRRPPARELRWSTLVTSAGRPAGERGR